MPYSRANSLSLFSPLFGSACPVCMHACTCGVALTTAHKTFTCPSPT